MTDTNEATSDTSPEPSVTVVAVPQELPASFQPATIDLSWVRTELIRNADPEPPQQFISR